LTGENPNPVFRVAGSGSLVCANEAGVELLRAMGSVPDGVLPVLWREWATACLESGERHVVDVAVGDGVCSLTFAPVCASDYVNVYGVDATERERAAREARRLSMAVEHAGEAIIITDAHGVIEYVNPAFERTTGYPSGEVVGRTPRILKSGKHDPAFYRQLWRTISQGLTWTGRFTNRRKDGSLYEEDATITAVMDDQGQVAHYVAVKRDVTQQVVLEKRLRHAQKMEAIGTLAGGIAHDFNNVLAAIIGYSQMASDELPEDSPLQADLGRVLAAADRARSLVRQILTFSRRGEEERQPLRLHTVVREVLKLLRSVLPATIEVREDIDRDCPPVLADPTQMHQVVMNLCTNAYQAMRDQGGVLTVALDCSDVDSAMAAQRPGLREGTYARLWVTDTGCGMDEATLARIFEPFFSTKGSEGGTGLGLATTHGIVSAHGGVVSVYSEVGKGSTFHVYLPCIEAGKPAEETAAQPIRGGNERILIVDDEESLARLLPGVSPLLGGSGVGHSSSGRDYAEGFDDFGVFVHLFSQ